jgi:hypothetical protein
MAKNALTNDSEFVVKEEKVLNYILAFLFFGLFLYGLIDAVMKGFAKLGYLSYVFMFALVPAIISYKKARSKTVYIRINKTGIYQYEKLITGWANFLKTYITQKEKAMSIQDNFLLVLEYRKDGLDKGFRKKIALTNTQNKSEEEVLAAIQFFWKEYKKDSGIWN